MDLPEFDGSGNRQPPGVGGIPVEQIHQARAEVGAVERPEDSPEVVAVMDQEAEAMRQVFEQQRTNNPEAPLEPPNTPPVETQQAPLQPEAPAEAPAPPNTPEMGSAPSTQPPPLDARVEQIREKYQGSFGEVAKALAHAQTSMSRVHQDKATEMGELRDMVSTTNAAVQNMQSQIAATTAQVMHPQTPPAPEPVQEPISVDRDEFMDDPMKHINGAITQHFQAFGEAMTQREHVRAQEQQIAARQDEVEQRPGLEVDQIS